MVQWPFLVNASIYSLSSMSSTCRTQPDDPSFPNQTTLNAFNDSIDGRLLHAIPSAQFCQERAGGCPDELWFNGNFRNDIPGALLTYNWEQDYDSNPPSLCLRNGTICGQGNVPVIAINATTALHIQAGVKFAIAHNLRVSIKASGHDYLGRSTAKGSLLLWTRYFQDVTFHDSFTIGSINYGSAVTVGSGVGLHTLYGLTRAQGKVFVGGTAASVVASGGYIQGTGHSALSPSHGLASDNALQFEIVVADGSLLIANSESHSDLFWALRGGGAGSWGVIISTTFRTFQTFDIVGHTISMAVNTTDQVAEIATVHAKHIFDLDTLQAGQYFYCTATPPTFTWSIATVFPNASLETAIDALNPFLGELNSLGFSPVTQIIASNVNDVLGSLTVDIGGTNVILGSRLWPSETYKDSVTAIGNGYKELFDGGTGGVLGHLVAGGQVSKNVVIDSAVNPKWRTAKTHMVITASWQDNASLQDIEAIREDLTRNKVPILDELAGPNAGAYSNEADVREPNFRETFFGVNYGRLSAVKAKYDPHGMFIVQAGVGSENWDNDGICRLK
ncbi:hypothetical protein M422DRAFT_217733 [Sphaerobolus stellatus SS14]|uniref:FAD-binding PCMH-type domain-containing protein n=1 Tax=Sphaerobolus stellatus (strain SS14) TaxID=990650 RepID=A0A0C9UCM9_SPHS4|nr:hypothetical protein M422DRAFT_217733 [Sphaerobolus stellatus SS14]